jgi:hypothetical protein
MTQVLSAPHVLFPLHLPCKPSDKRFENKLAMVVNDYNPSTWEAEAEGLKVWAT